MEKKNGSYNLIEKVQDELKVFIVNELLSIHDFQELSIEDNLLMLGLDSLRMMRLVNFIEKNFDVNLPDEEITPMQMRSIASIAQLIKRHS